MKAKHLAGPHPLVESIDVLGDEQELVKSVAPGRQDVVRTIRETGGHPLSSPGVPLPDQLRIARERVLCRELLGSVATPQTVGSSKGGDTVSFGDAGSREDRDPGVGVSRWASSVSPCSNTSSDLSSLYFHHGLLTVTSGLRARCCSIAGETPSSAAHWHRERYRRALAVRRWLGGNVNSLRE